ncbi:lipoprotein-anchoring transpeptidase ErfK/SrfK [Streptosporangium becharense]|uniref:Lipoprotein-anchoring transpeptidase ErfK/SrfK n=1 Tax=Streptosporangium becharense TaxID=1816182 RepID=A0A7W9IIS3_9ACTN|nr:L,D-transpeptidase [Streptosporangium becharense]MBB2913998.1 lipoprotein-anchoring transpeptidase ErfK/SrfK [Streptosporangium becharense]MBB5821341.1 lipoprotein-anchoring transpeptidase ErfK/SrfK [Streptosporangium becharense]
MTAVAAVIAVAALLTSCTAEGPVPTAGPTAPPPPSPAVTPRPIDPVPVPAARRARLPVATTYATLRRAPRDPDPFGPMSGLVVHPTADRVVYVRPGGPPLAVLPPAQLEGPTWVPVVERRPGWERVLLPSRPNRSTGWIHTGGGGLRSARRTRRVEIGLAARRLAVFDGDRRLGSWRVAVGAPGTPTPRGRTFLLASVSPARPTYTPRFLALGAHSGTLRTFAGGPATVALHGWPDEGVFGRAVSYGCVRVPSAALRVLSRLPPGSPVTITG